MNNKIRLILKNPEHMYVFYYRLILIFGRPVESNRSQRRRLVAPTETII